jgi:hypothetical protein
MGQAKHGKKYLVKIDTSGGTLTAIKVKNCDFQEDVELLDSTECGDTDKTTEVGFKDNKFTVTGNWTGSLDAHLGAILGQDATVSFELGPEGGVSTTVKYTGEARLVKFNKSGGVTSLIQYTAEFQVDGAVTRGTYA